MTSPTAPVAFLGVVVSPRGAEPDRWRLRRSWGHWRPSHRRRRDRVKDRIDIRLIYHNPPYPLTCKVGLQLRTSRVPWMVLAYRVFTIVRAKHVKTILGATLAILTVSIFGWHAQANGNKGAVHGPSILQDECSKQADKRGLHGQARWEFRKHCKNAGPAK
jgi:hypothetical protein